MRQLSLILLLLISCVCAGKLHAEILVVDDAGHTIALDHPAQRIISLAPSITELVYAVGAGDKLVGVVDYSDYPEQAKQLPIIGSYERPDYERILALQPDLIIAWQSGNGAQNIEKLKQLGFTVYQNESQELTDISHALKNIGRLAGAGRQAVEAVRQFEVGLQQLRTKYSMRTKVTVFYQIWNQPLYSISGRHFISKVIELCGGVNVFTDVPALVPSLSLEAIIQADPQVIIASGMDNQRPDWLDEWKQWQGMQAVARQHVYFINADYINRPTPRILLAAQQMCQQIDKARP